LRQTFPQKVSYDPGYNDPLAHRIEAGADLFLMPSRYEPCGLNQMYSLRYGTVPIVRRTGGLADTVQAYDPATGAGTGFVFDAFTSEALFGAVRSALELWRDRAAWDRLRRAGMQADYSWERQGRYYVRLYELLMQ
jgi:starch synthase